MQGSVKKSYNFAHTRTFLQTSHSVPQHQIHHTISNSFCGGSQTYFAVSKARLVYDSLGRR